MIGIISQSLDGIDLEEAAKANVTIFSNSNYNKKTQETSIFSSYMSYHFEGTILALHLQEAIGLLKNNTCEKRVYWVKSIEWHSFNTIPYRDLLNVFCNDDIKIVASDQTIFSVISKFFRKPDGMMNSLDEKLIEAL
jgi:hypothetical protein